MDVHRANMVRRHLRRPLLLQPPVSPLSPIPSPSHQLTLNSAWFNAFSFLELVYHLPLTLWAIPALLRNDPRVPLALLVFGLETSLTTLVCMVEMLGWEELSVKQRGLEGLGGMYGGYLALGKFFVFFSSFLFGAGNSCLMGV